MVSATVTTPVAALMVKPPPEVSPVSAVGHGRPVDVGRGCGDADGRAVGGAFRDGVGRARSLSTGVDGATSVTAMVKVCELVSVPSLACTVTV